MATTPVTVDCTKGTSGTCNQIQKADNSTPICKEVTNSGSGSPSTTCECNDSYNGGSSSSSASANACTATDLTCKDLGEKACGFTGGKCEWENSNPGNPVCKEKSAPAPAPTPDAAVDCSTNTDTKEKCTGAAGCSWDEASNETNKCVCAAGYGGNSATACSPCKETQYKAEAGVAACSACGEGKYTAPAAGSADGVTNATGPNTQCLDANSSSGASPLVFAMICALIVVLVASVTVSAVVIKRKANGANGAENLVSEAI